MKKSLLVLLSSFLIFTSCKDEEIDKNDVPSTASCLLTEVNYDNNNFTRKFTYNSLSQIVREDIIDNNHDIGYNTYEYSSNNLVKRNSYSQQGILENYYTYEYNSSNQLVKETSFTKRNGSMVTSGYVTYEYNSPTELKRSTHFYNNTQYYYTIYQYSNELMVKSQSFNANGSQGATKELEYDDKRGAYSTMASSLTLIGDSGFPHQKNITKYLVKNGNGQIVTDESLTNTYEYNVQGYAVKSSISRYDGVKRAETYSYKCQ